MSKYYKNSHEQVEFLIRELAITENSKGVDLGCDSGSHLVELQKISNQIYGVDLNPQLELKNFIQLDFFKDEIELRDLDFAYCLSPYFGDNWWNLEPLLNNLNKILKLGGVFILDLFDFNSKPIGSKTQVHNQSSDKTVLSTFTRQIDRMILDRMIIENGEQKNIKGIWRVFNFNEIADEFLGAGFAVVGQYSSFDSGEDVSWQPNVENKRVILKFKKV